ncbi:lipocalin family protein [Pseudogemmobacter sp. W21_MBD1_M6]|uniref:lipocalin family protein n=1 Tax=Pseudogemmobacter sp. W21_MBD1_M6 TaxID=3240271 RepID=UPI003F9BF169
MKRLILLMALAGCAAEPVSVATYRSPATPIYSAAGFDVTRMAGRWYEVEGIAADGARCPTGIHDFAVSGGVLTGSSEGCASAARLLGASRDVGQGRLQPEQGEIVWVLWVDETYRTAVVGTPSGRFGYILNRAPAIPADRLRAAREILDFNGYTVAAFTPFPR